MKSFSQRLLDWYDIHARELPWRVSPNARSKGVKPDPYHVWLSEIMLQQTTIPHGIPYFMKFLRLWPTLDDLARADRADVLKEWAGLGYYARARNLHACAQAGSAMGGFPRAASELVKLPGIGPYTAGAIAAIAFDQPVAAVDGNVERVLARHRAERDPLDVIKPDLRRAAQALMPETRAGDFVQAFMDLGATICAPKKPDCAVCPVADDCAGLALGAPERFPVKRPKPEKPLRYGHVFIRHDGKRVLLDQRPENGLLGGMLGLPTSDWRPLADGEAVPEPDGQEGRYVGRVQHVFTHFRLWLDVWEQNEKTRLESGSVPISELQNAGLPSVFMKAAKAWIKSRDAKS